jgi:PAS domain S-box-containing protein
MNNSSVQSETNRSQVGQLGETNEALRSSAALQSHLVEHIETNPTANGQAAPSLFSGEHGFREMIDALPAAIYTTDAKGKITHFNPACVEFSGRTPEIGTDHWCVTWKLYYPDGRPMPHDQCPMAIALKEGVAIRGSEAIAERPDGTRIWFMPYPTPLFDDAGEITGGINMLVDITERKNAESDGAYLAAIVESSDDAIVTKGLDGIITTWNASAERLFGYSAPEAIGKSITMIIPLDRLDEEPQIIERIRRGDRVDHFETQRVRKDGKLLDISLTISPVKDRAGRIVGASKVARDITDRKRAEQQLRQAKQEADEANIAKDMFLATLSHEMRTPLSAITGWMHILRGGKQAGCSDAELNEGLDVIDRNSQTMVQLINDVLDVSRIISGKLRLDVRPYELDEIIRNAIDVVRPAAQARDIKLGVEFDPAANAVSCDAARMQQVVWNLLSNAIKFTPKGGVVRVTLDRTQSDFRIAISDNGQGIAPDLLPYVFDRFRQADSSTRRQLGGLGLGLSIAKHLVEMHGGTIRADSPGEGRGATFTVLLPIRAVRTDEAGDVPPGEEFERCAKNGQPLVRLDALRVLVVDDDPDARRLLTKLLQQTGAVVTAAASAAAAMEMLPKVDPEVLVSDLGMPVQDGFDLIRQVRARGHQAKDLPAVALTAFVRKQDERQALLAGFQMHVPKPVDPHYLTAVIASLAGRTGTAT